MASCKPLELALERGVDHARAELDDEAAEQARDRRGFRPRPCRPTALRSCSSSRSRCAGVSGCAATTSAVTSPRRAARARRESASIISGSAKSRRLRARRPRKFRVSGCEPGALGERRDRLALLARGRAPGCGSGGADRRSRRSARAAPRRSSATCVERLALVGEIEQRRRVALGQPACACRFGCHV